ncbi:hypothetical protein DL766_005812 [Monosporascus sp. MC13-8B]|nr:hypothetical protein DL763_009160 [Monosporascus cannonballus]RYP28526.1 hypothetical protein DL766_005812 [Monosporascus sp. MC13-8B]
MQDILPFVQVSHLGPAASFYSAITHPLGLKFLQASSSSIVFGTTTPALEPVFEVRLVGSGEPLRRSRLVLSAPSLSAVADFHAAALRSEPKSRISGEGEPSDQTRIQDLDGNIMEVVYVNPPGYPSKYGGATVRRTQSTEEEASRILDWNFDVAMAAPTVVGSAAGVPAPTAVSRHQAPGYDVEPRVLRRSVTDSTVVGSQAQTSKGMSAGAMFGTVLGAVAGAAVGGSLAYSLIQKGRDRASQQEYDLPCRYVEVERAVEKVHHPEGYAAVSKKYPPPSLMARYSQVGGPTARALEDVDDRASRYTTSSRARGRSEAGSTRRPLMIDEAEYRSSAGSKHTATPRLLPEANRRSNAPSKYGAPSPEQHREGDHRSSADPRYVTSKPPTEADYRSRAGSRYTAAALPRRATDDNYRSHRSSDAQTYVASRAPSKAGSRYAPSAVKAPSCVSARELPEVPQDKWDDDTASLAPEDSISNVGVREEPPPPPPPPTGKPRMYYFSTGPGVVLPR